MTNPHYSDLIKKWSLDQNITFLNHGSFGATPTSVIDFQRGIQDKLHADPVKFFARDSEALWWKNKSLLASFLHCKSENMTLVHNTTTGINTIFNNLNLPIDSEVLITNHIYSSCAKQVAFFAKKNQWKVNTAMITLPILDENEVVEALVKSITPNTKVLLIDHITSASGLIFPIEKIIPIFKEKGIIVIVDGAHAPGMLDLHLDELGADFYVGNIHKWCYVPNGSAIMYVAPKFQADFHPMVLSHYYDKPLENGAERWAAQFFWRGTEDSSAMFCFEEGERFVHTIFPKGWEEMRTHNRNLLLEARKMLMERHPIQAIAPESMLGFMFMFPTRKVVTEAPKVVFNLYSDIQHIVFEKFKIEMPVYPFKIGAEGRWCMRISAQAYNDMSQYEYVCDMIEELMKEGIL
jgi:isopenicillin-N epimerase